MSPERSFVFDTNVLVNTHITLCRDPRDDKFLSLALEIQAECITSGDKDLLVLSEVFPVPILTPAQFLQEKQPVN